MPGQMLMLENAHAYGVTVFAVNKELMDQFTFHHKSPAYGRYESLFRSLCRR